MSRRPIDPRIQAAINLLQGKYSPEVAIG